MHVHQLRCPRTETSHSRWTGPAASTFCVATTHVQGHGIKRLGEYTGRWVRKLVTVSPITLHHGPFDAISSMIMNGNGGRKCGQACFSVCAVCPSALSLLTCAFIQSTDIK